MKQILNGFKDYYYLTENGEVYNNKTSNYVGGNRFCKTLVREDGTRKSVTIKKLYKLVYGKNFCIDNIESLPGEVWKEIAGTDETYWISNKGRVKSYASNEAKLLKLTSYQGYNKAYLVYPDRSRCNKRVSRLVAAAFLFPPENIDCQLHHINKNTGDDRVENLVWLTPEKHREVHRQMKAAEARAAAEQEEKNND